MPTLSNMILFPICNDTALKKSDISGSEVTSERQSQSSDKTKQLLITIKMKLSIRSIAATQAVVEDEIGNGLNQMRYSIRPYYRLMPGLSIFTEFEYDQDYGEFKTIRRNAGESTKENTLTFGVSVIF